MNVSQCDSSGEVIGDKSYLQPKFKIKGGLIEKLNICFELTESQESEINDCSKVYMDPGLKEL